MMLRRASVIATLSLFAWAATASAQCAWVLWMTIGSGWTGISDVTRLSAFKSSRECEIAIPQMVASQMKIGPNRSGRSDAGVAFAWRGPRPRPSNEEPITRYEWSCWPDTVDPRETKERWVLWTQAAEPGLRGWWSGATWTPSSAHESKEACESSSRTSGGWRCLPDTVDPRGPKAMGR